MKSFAGIILALILTAGSANAYEWGRPGRSRPADDSRLIVMKIDQAPVVTLRAVLEVGSIDDPCCKEGLCWLTMHAAAEGGTPLLSHAEVSDLLYPMAASVNVFVDRETTVFSATVRAEDLAEFYPIFRDLIFHPRFDESDIERVRDRSLSRIENDLRGRSDEALGKEGLQSFLFCCTRLEGTPVGTVSGIRRIERSDIVGFHEETVVRSRLWFGVGGAFDDAFVRQLENDLAEVPATGLQRARVNGGEIPAIHGLEIRLIEKPTQSTAISIGFTHDVGPEHPDYYPLFLAMIAFGEHRTFLGRLQREMRKTRGLNYGNYAYINHFQQDRWSHFPMPNLWRSIPYFSIWIRPVQPANGPFALRQAIWELKNLIDHGLSPEEFETTREHIRNVSQLWEQSLSRRVGSAIDGAYYGNGDRRSALVESLDGMTCGQVNAALKLHLTGRNLKAVLVCADADSIRQTLLDGTATPIVYAGATAPPEVLAKDEQIESMPLGIGRIEIVPVGEMFE